MNHRAFLAVITVISSAASAFSSNQASSEASLISGNAVVQEMNLARQNPSLYATYIEALRGTFDGKYLMRGPHNRLITKEGVRAYDEAIQFLRSSRPLPPFTVSQGLSRGAADHCVDQAAGALGHNGHDGSSPAKRIARYGTWSISCGENISYGKKTARDIVVALIVDDGVRSRGHRKNIFNPNFNYAGAAYGPHALYGSVCTTDFAGAYAEQGQSLAKNF